MLEMQNSRSVGTSRYLVSFSTPSDDRDIDVPKTKQKWNYPSGKSSKWPNQIGSLDFCWSTVPPLYSSLHTNNNTLSADLFFSFILHQ